MTDKINTLKSLGYELLTADSEVSAVDAFGDTLSAELGALISEFQAVVAASYETVRKHEEQKNVALAQAA